MKPFSFSLLGFLSFFSLASYASDVYEQCLLTQISTASDELTIGQIKALCEQGSDTVAETQHVLQTEITVSENGVETDDESAITRRLFLESKESNNPFVLLPHKPNYIMFSNNMASPNETPFEVATGKNVHFQPWETKFQISLKMAIMRGLFDNRADWYAGYTNRSFWQQFNKNSSAPFRETNHEPETWLSFRNDYELWGLKNSVIRTGVVHQSNGQSGNLSRSWNRVYADFIFETGDWYFSLKPWWRIPDPSDNDDNPDIEEYMGNFEFRGMYQAGAHNFSYMLRNNLNFDDNYGAVELGWSFPLSDRVRGYVQWFNGYGESMIDYDAHSNSIGFGIMLSDWI